MTDACFLISFCAIFHYLCGEGTQRRRNVSLTLAYIFLMIGALIR